MSFLNPQSKEINCKIVYVGPPFSGKSTNLRSICSSVSRGQNGSLVTLTEKEDRTLFFDFLPLSLGKIKGFNIRLHLYTVPGQTQFDASRKIILKGVDGVVFVADSQVDRLENNLESWRNLRQLLAEVDSDFKTVPMVVQLNKRDLDPIVPVPEMTRALDGRQAPHLESIATKGKGVMETLQVVARQVLRGLKKS